MPFTVRDFRSLVRALDRRQEWKAELRRLLLTEELLSLPQVVRELAAGQARLTAEVRGLAAAQGRTDERLDRLTAEVQGLAVAQRRTDERLDRLTEEVRRLAEEVRQLVEAQRIIGDRLGRLEGSDLERRYRERAAGYFQRILSRIRLVDHQELALMLDDAVEAGTISTADKEEILFADVVVRGRRDQLETYLLAEVSVVVDIGDVRRAASRARLLGQATGAPVLAAVAGQTATSEAEQGARAASVWRLLDGRVEGGATPGS